MYVGTGKWVYERVLEDAMKIYEKLKREQKY
jgi:hypothetical protein